MKKVRQLEHPNRPTITHDNFSVDAAHLLVAPLGIDHQSKLQCATT
jgi:hypothetical protein